jgi:O-succinylbenzoate synthase
LSWSRRSFLQAPLTQETNMNSTIDFEADAKAVPVSNTQLQQVATAAQRMLTLQRKIAEAEEWVKTHKEMLQNMRQTEIPELMDSVGMASFVLDSGQTVEVKPVCAGSIPKANEAEAIQWIRKNGHGGIVKHKLEVSLGKGQDKLAPKVVSELKKLGVEVTQKEFVHPQTLGAWARELVEKGKTFPAELLGIYVGRQATVK